MSKPKIDPFKKIATRKDVEEDPSLLESNDDLVENPFAQIEDKADPMVPTATLQIYQGISKHLEDRKDNNVNRASAASMCVKRRWYQKNGEEGTPLTPRKLVNFQLGDLTERTLLFKIKKHCVGDGKLYSEVSFGEVVGSFQSQGNEIEVYKQETLSFEINGITITGHADGFGKRNSDGKWELIEIKSAADYGFKEFQENGPGDYLKQSHTLMMTDKAKSMDIKDVRFFYLRKSTGHIWDRVFSFNEELANTVIEEFKQAASIVPPKAPYGYIAETTGRAGNRKPTGRFSVPWQCQYCPFLKQCKGNYELEWKADQFGHMKPVYIFKAEESDAI